jgi:hypothetical protein
MRWIACLVLMLCAHPLAAAPVSPWSPSGPERATLAETALQRWNRLFPQGNLRPHADTRDLIALALDTAAGGGEHIQHAGGRPDDTEYRFTQAAPPGATHCRAWVYSSIKGRTRIVLSDLAFEHLEGDTATLLGGYDFQRFQPQRIPVPAGSTLVLQRGSAALALRLLGASSVDGKEIGWTLHNDGLAHRALRLTAVHADGPASGSGAIAVWALARGGLTDDGKAAAFRREAQRVSTNYQLSEGILDVSVSSRQEGVPPHLRADLVRNLRLVREGGDPMPSGCVRAVAGQDVGFPAP